MLDGDLGALGGSGMVEIQFEPIGPEEMAMNEQSPAVMLDAMRAQNKQMQDANKRMQDALHVFGAHDLERMFDQEMSSSHALRGHRGGNGFGTMRAGPPKPSPEEEDENPMLMISHGRKGTPTSISASTLRQLFPGPGLMMEEDMAPMPMPFGSPDIAILNMLNQMDEMFAQDFLPVAHRAASAGRTPDSCGPYVRHYCRRAPSQLHCLGQHVDEVSDECREDVGKSVPFVCSTAIDKFCNLLEKSILECLGAHVEKLEDSCRDAVVATQHVIAKANSQRATVTDPVTGIRKVNVPSKKQSPEQREVKVDAQLGSSKAIQIDAQNDNHPAETKSMGIYRADFSTVSNTSKPVTITKDGSSTAKMDNTIVSNKDSADTLLFHKADTLLFHKASLLLLSKEGSLVCLVLTAFLSLVLLRSQCIAKFVTKSRDPFEAVSLYCPSAPSSVEVTKLVVASGQSNKH